MQTAKNRPFGSLRTSVATFALALALALATTLTTAVSAQSKPVAAPGPTLAAFDLSKGMLQDLKLPKVGGAGFVVDVDFAGKVETLVLRAHDVRAANFKLMVSDADGIHQVPTPANVTFRGVVAKHNDSIVSASLINGQLSAIVRFAPGKGFWAVQPLGEVQKGAVAATHIVYRSSDTAPRAVTCGVVKGDSSPAVKPRASLAATTYLCDIAVDADYPFYQKNGSSVTTTQNDVTAVINNVATIYKADVDIDYKLTTIVVRTKAIYTSTTHLKRLTEFRNYWNKNHKTVVRDVAHIFTGAKRTDGYIGWASVGVVCTSSGYGLSDSRYTTNMTSRTGLTAHELGHNWSCGHCNSQTTCNIMCSSIGGCSRKLTTFTTWERNYIIAHRNSRSCLTKVTNSGPVLKSLQPTTAKMVFGGPITLTGTGLASVYRVDVGGAVVYAGGFKKHTATSIIFDSPLATSTVSAPVTVRSNNGTSNALTLSYQLTHPPILRVPTTIDRGKHLIWEFGGIPNYSWILTLSGSNTTFDYRGFKFLTGPVLFGKGALSPTGYGFRFVLVPTTVTVGLKIYSQIVTRHPTAGFTGNSNIAPTTIK